MYESIKIHDIKENERKNYTLEIELKNLVHKSEMKP